MMELRGDERMTKPRVQIKGSAMGYTPSGEFSAPFSRKMQDHVYNFVSSLSADR